MKKLLILPMAFLMMGNQQCDSKEPETRELRRRVEMGTIKAPPISLPEGGKFDFQFAANSQMYEVLRKTKSFSTSTMDGTFQLEQMTLADREAFNKCDDVVLNEDVGLKGMQKTGQVSTVATCMINSPQALIEGSVTGFELTNSVGLSFDILKPIDLGVSFLAKKATLSMSFQANDPYIPGHNIAATTSKANRQEFNINANINFGGFGIGPSAYFKSALADVVNKAMVNGITNLKQQMDENSPWFTTVYRNCDKAILINAGGAADAGLRVGDVLEVYNVRYEWTGKVCESQLHGSIPSTPMGEPIAVAVVKIVGDTVSQAEVIEQSVTKIQPGSRVYVRKLIEPQPVKKSGTPSTQRLAGQ